MKVFRNGNYYVTKDDYYIGLITSPYTLDTVDDFYVVTKEDEIERLRLREEILDYDTVRMLSDKGLDRLIEETKELKNECKNMFYQERLALIKYITLRSYKWNRFDIDTKMCDLFNLIAPVYKKKINKPEV